MHVSTILLVGFLFLCFCGPLAVIRFALGVAMLIAIVLGLCWFGLKFAPHPDPVATREVNRRTVIQEAAPGTTEATAIPFSNKEQFDKYPVGTWLKDVATNIPFQKRRLDAGG